MGGAGSTRWNCEYTRSRVEDCFSILPPVPSTGHYGFYSWPYYHFAVEVRVDVSSDNPHLRRIKLNFPSDDGIVNQSVTICATKPNFGGLRWWFRCPACYRRVAHLHMPRWSRGASAFFLCRVCHDLSYESAQYHRSLTEAIMKLSAIQIGGTHRQGRRHFRARYGRPNHTPARAAMIDLDKYKTKSTRSTD